VAAVDTNKSQPAWRKSSHSGGNGECVEVAGLSAGIGVRDSKAPDAGHLAFTRRAWAAFATQVSSGRYDR
jgi:hypothetical protein